MIISYKTNYFVFLLCFTLCFCCIILCQIELQQEYYLRSSSAQKTQQA